MSCLFSQKVPCAHFTTSTSSNFTMVRSNLAICVSTSKPTSSLTPGGGGGAVSLICPQTGSILSSLRAAGDNSSKSLLGLSSISMFPSKGFGTQNTALMMAYGGTLARKDDTYGMLMTLRNVSSPPIMNWKCRLPEAQMSSGLLVSPCGHYIVGGSNAGNIHVWSSLGGSYLRTIKAHYRPVTTMVWSDCDAYLVSGGADGMVHAFSIMDLVDRSDSSRTVSPVRTWSAHHLPVTALQALEGSRVVSASEDGQLVIMELFSETTLCSIQISHGIKSLAYHDGLLFAGSVQGTIYTIDLDVYAAHQTSQLGVTVKRRRVEDMVEDKVFENVDNNANDCYKTELRGHEKTVTALAVMVEEQSAFLISGDTTGVLRVWDLESRGCVRVIQPWSHSVRASTSDVTSEGAKSSGSHPVTSILIVPRFDDSVSQQQQQSTEAFSSNHTSNNKESKANSIVNLVTPLKRFSEQAEDSTGRATWAAVPFLRPKRTRESIAYLPLVTRPSPTAQTSKATSGGATTADLQELARLRQELAEVKERTRALENENESLKAQ
jgi:WD40 repeat protein